MGNNHLGRFRENTTEAEEFLTSAMDATNLKDLKINVGDIDNSRGHVNIGYFANGVEGSSSLARYRSALYLEDPKIVSQGLIDKKGQRAPRTCEWIRVNATYRQWLDGDNKLLRLIGSAGRGKTMLSIFLVEELTKSGVVLYVFCRSGQLDSATALLRTLIWQLAEYCPNPELVLQQYLELDNPKRVQDTLESKDTLWSIFTGLLRQRQEEATVCIIDGLDECDQMSRDWLAANLASATVAAHGIRLKSIILSRPTEAFVSSMYLELLLDDLKDARQDVQATIAAGVSALRDRVKDIDDDFAESVRARLQEKAQNTFLWAGFAITELRKCKTRMQIDEVLDSLGSLPPGLFALYKRMILQIPVGYRPMCLRILRWVVLAPRPLTLQELAGAVGLDHAANNVVPDYVTHCGDMLVTSDRKGTQRKSKGTRKKNDCILTIVHQSAKDYLLQEEAAAQPINDDFRLLAQASHTEAARTCLQYLIKYLNENDEIWRDLRDKCRCASTRLWGWYETYIEKAPLSPFFKYSLQNWTYHAKEASTHSEILFTEFDASFFSPSSALYPLLTRSIGNGLPRDFPSPIHLASIIGATSWARLILSKQPWIGLWGMRVKSLDKTSFRGIPLSIAASKGHEELTNFLIDKGANVDGVPDSRPLVEALKGGHSNIARQLIRAGADPNKAEKNGDTALLHVCSHRGSLETMQLLLEHGANVNAIDRDGETPLHSVCKSRDLRAVKLLLAHGSDVHYRLRWNGSKETPLHYSARAGTLDIARALIEGGASKQAAKANGFSPIRYAGEGPGNTDDRMFRLLLDKDTDLLLKDRSFRGEGSLMHCLVKDAIKADNRVLLELLESKYSGLCGSDSKTIRIEYLCAAARRGRLAIAKFLIQKGAEIDARAQVSTRVPVMFSPLHHAAESFDYNIIQLLLKSGADPNIRVEASHSEAASIYNYIGSTPLDVVFGSQKVGHRLGCFETVESSPKEIRKCAQALVAYGGQMVRGITVENSEQMRLLTEEELNLWLREDSDDEDADEYDSDLEIQRQCSCCG